MLITYFKTFLSKRRYTKGVSLLSLWDNVSKISSKTYLAIGVRISNSNIGDYSRIRHFSTLHYTTVGKFSAIGKNSRIGIGRHPVNLLSTNLIFYKKNQIKNNWARPINFQEYKKIVIGNDVWIGENSTVMGGVTIGDGAIIASKAVVTKDVPPYAIVGGIPAKIIKYRFEEQVINKLLEIKWWDLPEEKIEEKLEVFTLFNVNNKILEKYFN